MGVLISRNSIARHRALETMRYMDDGTVKVKIGGRVRGRVVTRASRRAAVQTVTKHYDEALLRALTAQGWKRHRGWMHASVKALFRKYTGRKGP
jgi:hypothetical protein